MLKSTSRGAKSKPRCCTPADPSLVVLLLGENSENSHAKVKTSAVKLAVGQQCDCKHILRVCEYSNMNWIPNTRWWRRYAHALPSVECKEHFFFSLLRSAWPFGCASCTQVGPAFVHNVRASRCVQSSLLYGVRTWSSLSKAMQCVWYAPHTLGCTVHTWPTMV